MKNEEQTSGPDELRDAPLLRNLRSSTIFSAPDGYFDQLSSSIQDKISSTGRRSTRSFLKPVLAGISLALAITIIYLFVPTKSPLPQTSNSIMEIQVSADDLITSNYYLELEEELLADALNSPDFNAPAADPNLENYLLETTSEEDLLNEL